MGKIYPEGLRIFFSGRLETQTTFMAAQRREMMLETLFRYRSLLFELVKREFAGRYRGSLGGALWSLAEPLFMLTVYIFSFGVIMQARWSAAGDPKEYGFMMFAGLIIFQAFSECLNKGPRLIIANPNFVKKVVFPLEILSWVMSITTLAHLLVAVMLWLAGYALLFGAPHSTVLYFPLVLAAFFPVLLAVGWLLAAIGVVVRDVEQMTGMLGRALLFMTPIFYNVETAPTLIKSLLLLNPLTFIIEQFRLVLYVGQPPNFLGLVTYFALAVAASTGASFIFRRMRPFFADNL